MHTDNGAFSYFYFAVDSLLLFINVSFGVGLHSILELASQSHLTRANGACASDVKLAVQSTSSDASGKDRHQTVKSSQDAASNY